MKIDHLGFIHGEGVRWHASPFFDERSVGCVPELIVVHNISLPARQFGTGCVQGLFDGTLDCSQHPTFDSVKGLEVSSGVLFVLSVRNSICPTPFGLRI